MTLKMHLYIDFKRHFHLNQSTSSDFAKVFTHFAQISTYFARISGIFAKSKLLGVRLHPAPIPLVLIIRVTKS